MVMLLSVLHTVFVHAVPLEALARSCMYMTKTPGNVSPKTRRRTTYLLPAAVMIASSRGDSVGDNARDLAKFTRITKESEDTAKLWLKVQQLYILSISVEWRETTSF